MHRCFVCGHGERGALEAAWAEGASLCEVSRRFGVPVAELYHHLTVHVAIREAKGASEDPVAAALAELTAATGALVERATIRSGDPRLAARVLGLRQRQLESLVRVQSARAKTERLDLPRTAEWAELRSTILEALGLYPEALQALALALERREGVR